MSTRNAPCPCGSGAKFKRCACGGYEATQFPIAKQYEQQARANEKHHRETYERIDRRRGMSALSVLLAGAALSMR